MLIFRLLLPMFIDFLVEVLEAKVWPTSVAEIHQENTGCCSVRLREKNSRKKRKTLILP